MKQRIFSGIQPSGNLHIGNYLGAIKNWVKLQDEYDSIFCVVDMHAITVPQDPEELRKRTLKVAKIYLAAGIDPKKCSLFIQSHVSEHAELAWILNTITKMSDLDKAGIIETKTIESEISERLRRLEKNVPGITEKILKASEEKEKIQQEDVYKLLRDHADFAGIVARFLKLELERKKEINSKVGLFDYPVLMAADIILYNTQVVPVGEDQVQHIELARDLAKRFNHKFGDTFTIPKAFLKEEGMRIMGLDDPTKKMSKSAQSEYNYIALNDDEETVRKKIKKAVTDSGSEIVYRDDKPALKNLINIYSLFSDMTPKEIEKKYQGKGYADFKNDLAEVIISFLRPFQERMAELSDKKVLQILEKGASQVRPIAKKKLDEVKKKIGFVSQKNPA